MPAFAQPGRAPAPGLGAAHSGTLVALLVALAALAWVALWWWSASPYGRYAAHGGWTDLAFVAALCSAVPQGSIVVPAVLHALAWVLMIAAMMLPTTYPLLALFRRIVAGRADAALLVGLVVAGFFAVWFVFGLLAHGADELLVWAAPDEQAAASTSTVSARNVPCERRAIAAVRTGRSPWVPIVVEKYGPPAAASAAAPAAAKERSHLVIVRECIRRPSRRGAGARIQPVGPTS